MKVLSLFVVPGVLALAISAAKADPSPNPEMGGAQTMPSGAEAQTPPPATYDPGTPGVAPATPAATPANSDTPSMPATPSATDTATPPAGTATPAAPLPEETNPALPPPGTPAAPTQTPTGATNITVLPPPPNGQVTESVPVAPLPPVPGAPEGAYPGANVYSHVGVGLLVGGGFNQYTNGRLQNVTGDGGFWTARVVAGTREYVGMEAAYIGDARSISGLGLSNDSRLISNGLSGNLRINIPVIRGASLVEPFGFVGVGWQHYTVTNNNVAVSDAAAGASGSSAIPQMGQSPGLSRRTSGCIGQVQPVEPVLALTEAVSEAPR